MGLLRKILGERTDIIQWLDESQDTLVWRYERYKNEIKYGAKLTVRESQLAVFVNEGEVADIISPGMYELETNNLPLLSTLQSWHYGFNSPFKAEVYFCSTKQFVDVKWGTRKPIMVRDSELGPIRVQAFGNFCFRIVDPTRLIKEISGTDGHFTLDEIQGGLKTLISAKLSNTISSNKVQVLDLSSHIPEIEKQLVAESKNDFSEYGLQLIRILIENISLPDSIEKDIGNTVGSRFTGQQGARERLKSNTNSPECRSCGAPFSPETSACLYCDASKPPHYIIRPPKKRQQAGRPRSSLLSYILVITLIAVIIYSFSVINNEINNRSHRTRSAAHPVSQFVRDTMKTFGFMNDKDGRLRRRPTGLPSGHNDMDELNKGIRVYRVVNANTQPTGFDSLVQVDNTEDFSGASYIEIGADVNDIALKYITGQQLHKIAESGLDRLMYISHDQNPVGKGNCEKGSLKELVGGNFNRVSGSTIFMTPSANGCGVAVDFSNVAPQQEVPIIVWTGNMMRLLGKIEQQPYNHDGNSVCMVVGIGKSSSLFNPNMKGTLSTRPTYPGAYRDEYNSYLAVFDIGTYKNGEIETNKDWIRFIGILAGHGQTANELI